MSMLKLDKSVMLRNYIKKADNTIVINSPTVVSLASHVTVSDETKAKAKILIDAVSEAVKIIDAVEVEGNTVTIMGSAFRAKDTLKKITDLDQTVNNTGIKIDQILKRLARLSKQVLLLRFQLRFRTKSTRAPSPLRSPEKKDVQKKPVNTSSQKSSDSRSRGRGRGGVKPAACGPGDRRLSSHNRFSTLADETEMEIESVPPPERSQSQGERNKNAGKLDSIRPSIIK
ncbi:Hypothetical predicted protein [Mytilus galloprovincialis]|uniref:Uncharacterized protein n=1 Tax=Mytilus galloprovincialis TaxID=29158 RepID=A0A8B6D019_MYTGA|nr:Hypothetical predicted protein [Mytilus galloprovincialis]